MPRKSRKPDNLPCPEAIPSIERKTAIYLRLSKEDKYRKNDSLENQRKITENHLLTLPELGTATIYEDNGFSGQSSNRPELQRLLSDIKNGLICCVIVKDLSRLGRNTLDTCYYLDKFFPEKEVRFIAVTDNYDSLTDQANILVAFKNMLNEAYAIDLGQKIQAAKCQIRLSGGYTGNIPPYGYKKQDGNPRQLLIDEVSAVVVREIYHDVANGDTLSSVTQKLNLRKELSPSNYERMKAGKDINPNKYWSRGGIKKIVQSQMYIGNMHQGFTTNINRRIVRNDPSEFILVENTHEAIVSKELFTQVQEILQTKSKPKTNTSINIPNMFTGKIFCGSCGKPMQRRVQQTKSGNTIKYRCHIGYTIGCPLAIKPTNVIISEIDILCVIKEYLSKQAEILLGKKIILAQKELELENVQSECNRQQKDLEVKIKKNQKYLKSLFENLVSNVISSNEYRELKEDYEYSLKQAKAQYIEITTKANELIQEIRLLCEISSEMNQQEFEVTPQIVNSMIQKITVLSKTELDIQFSYQFAAIDEVIADG